MNESNRKNFRRMLGRNIYAVADEYRAYGSIDLELIVALVGYACYIARRDEKMPKAMLQEILAERILPG
jgi:hypothetical protein